MKAREPCQSWGRVVSWQRGLEISQHLPLPFLRDPATSPGSPPCPGLPGNEGAWSERQGGASVSVRGSSRRPLAGGRGGGEWPRNYGGLAHQRGLIVREDVGRSQCEGDCLLLWSGPLPHLSAGDTTEQHFSKYSSTSTYDICSNTPDLSAICFRRNQ